MAEEFDVERAEESPKRKWVNKMGEEREKVPQAMPLLR